MPYLTTIDLATIFSLPKPTAVDFHCEGVDKMGPDSSMMIAGRGSFRSQSGCTLKIPDFQLTYSPSSEVILDFDLTDIHPRFSTHLKPSHLPTYTNHFVPTPFHLPPMPKTP